jgi:hypothetical protein
MQIKKIHSMRWATEDKTFVGLIADTDTGNNESIGTPYNEASIIWDAVKAFPVNQIEEYVEPPPVIENELGNE